MCAEIGGSTTLGSTTVIGRYLNCIIHGDRYSYTSDCPACVLERYEKKCRKSGLNSDSKTRKTYPIATGVVDYFPDALAEIARVSYIGNEQHNPGQPLHWDRSKSQDEADALMRHFIQRGTLDSDGTRHSAKVAWRALALLQKELEHERNKGNEGNKGEENCQTRIK